MHETGDGWTLGRPGPGKAGDPAALLHDAYAAPPDDFPEVFARHVSALGCQSATVFLVDLQQVVLVPYLSSQPDGGEHHAEPLAVDSTTAGRCYQLQRVLVHDGPGDAAKAWVPLRRGNERVGVASVTARPGRLADDSLRADLTDLASVAAHVIWSRSAYVDDLVALGRQGVMGIAAEMQWALLPPLTYASGGVSVSGQLEPAYDVAGDSIDYGVSRDGLRFGVFDSMGHGMNSAQTAMVAVNAYRNARRAQHLLHAEAQRIDEAIAQTFGMESFTTAVLAHLDTATGLLTWLNAGHPPPLLFRGGRLVKLLTAEPVLPLGLWSLTGAERAASATATEQLRPGDRLVLYTDGVIEARSPDGTMFGVDRLVDAITRTLADGLPAPESTRRITAAVLAHQADHLDDDASLLLVGWDR